MARNILKRAVALQVPGIVLEFELLPAMTENPEWGAEITAILHRHLRDAPREIGAEVCTPRDSHRYSRSGKAAPAPHRPGLGEAQSGRSSSAATRVPTSCRSNPWAARRFTTRL